MARPSTGAKILGKVAEIGTFSAMAHGLEKMAKQLISLAATDATMVHLSKMAMSYIRKNMIITNREDASEDGRQVFKAAADHASTLIFPHPEV